VTDGGRSPEPDPPGGSDSHGASGGPDSHGASGGPAPATPSERRPWLERIGLAAIAIVMGAMLTFMAIVAWVGGEGILAAMSAAGAVLTIGVGLMTLIRG
jgi:hypothetical protein